MNGFSHNDGKPIEGEFVLLEMQGVAASRRLLAYQEPNGSGPLLLSCGGKDLLATSLQGIQPRLFLNYEKAEIW